jgi:hypothetical protein
MKPATDQEFGTTGDVDLGISDSTGTPPPVDTSGSPGDAADGTASTGSGDLASTQPNVTTTEADASFSDLGDSYASDSSYTDGGGYSTENSVTVGEWNNADTAKSVEYYANIGFILAPFMDGWTGGATNAARTLGTLSEEGELFAMLDALLQALGQMHSVFKEFSDVANVVKKVWNSGAGSDAMDGVSTALTIAGVDQVQTVTEINNKVKQIGGDIKRVKQIINGLHKSGEAYVVAVQGIWPVGPSLATTAGATVLNFTNPLIIQIGVIAQHIGELMSLVNSLFKEGTDTRDSGQAYDIGESDIEDSSTNDSTHDQFTPDDSGSGYDTGTDTGSGYDTGTSGLGSGDTGTDTGSGYGAGSGYDTGSGLGTGTSGLGSGDTGTGSGSSGTPADNSSSTPNIPAFNPEMPADTGLDDGNTGSGLGTGTSGLGTGTSGLGTGTSGLGTGTSGLGSGDTGTGGGSSGTPGGGSSGTPADNSSSTPNIPAFNPEMPTGGELASSDLGSSTPGGGSSTPGGGSSTPTDSASSIPDIPAFNPEMPELSDSAPNGVGMSGDGTLTGPDGKPLAAGPGDTSMAPGGDGLLGSDGGELAKTDTGWENPLTGEQFDSAGNSLGSGTSPTAGAIPAFNPEMPDLSTAAPDGVEMADDGTLIGAGGEPLSAGPGDTTVAPDGSLLGPDGSPLEMTDTGWENPLTGEQFDTNGNLVEAASAGDAGATHAERLPDGVHVDPETGDLVGADGRALDQDPLTGLPILEDGTLLDPLTGQPLPLDTETNLPIDPATGALIDGNGDFLDPDTLEKLPEDEERGLIAHVDSGVMTDPTTGMHFNADGVLSDADGTALEIDEMTGKPMDSITGELLDPETGRLLDPTGAASLDLDPTTGLPVDGETGQLINPHTGQRFDPNTLMPASAIATGSGTVGEPHVITVGDDESAVTVEVDADRDQSITVDLAGDDAGPQTVTVEDGQITVNGTEPPAGEAASRRSTDAVSVS